MATTQHTPADRARAAKEARDIHHASCRHRAQGLACSACTDLDERAQRMGVLARPAIREVRARFADLFVSCPCGELAEGADGLCDRCASNREWEARRASRKGGAA